ncbi:MAG: T9SS type A sorting domain-containing protein [Bacteroidales bacterium]|nr:T9SS type A sorting domain-containing protein [Bacteroidales bacterium]
MKRYIIFIFFLLSIINSNKMCLSQGWILSTTIRGSFIEPGFSAIDNQNNLVVLSYFTDTVYNPYFTKSYGLRDLFLFKVSKNGEILWYNRIGNTGPDIHGGIAIDNQNNIYVTGTYNNICKFTPNDSLINSGTVGNIFLAKYSSDGTFSWAKAITSASTLESALDLKFDGNNKLILSGFYKDSIVIGSSTLDKDTLLGNAYNSNFIASFSLDGLLNWAKGYLGTNNTTRFWRIGIGQNGYYFGGFFQGDLTFDIGTISSYTSTSYDAFLYKTDLDGNGEWVRRIRGQGTENFRAISSDEYDNIYVLGNYNSTDIFVDSTANRTLTISGNMGGYDTYIGKYNRSGILQWFLRKGSTSKDIYQDFVIRNNIIYATGYFANQIIFQNDTLNTSGASNEDAFVAAFNEIGDPIAGVSIVGTGDYNDAGTIVNMDSDSRAYVSGYYKSHQIQIGDSIYTSTNVNKSDLFFAIYEHPPKAVITDEQMVSCNGLSDGMLQVTPYFMNPPYTYKWSHNPGLNQSVATNLPAGTYTATIVDGNLDSAKITAVVTQPDPLAIVEVITEPACYNGSDGVIDITVTGGTAAEDYNYAWTTSGGSGVNPSQQDQSGISEGIYYVTITDDNGCLLKDTFDVEQPMPIVFAGSMVTDVILPPGNNGSIIPVVSGGTSPYSYAWTGPDSYSSNDDTITGLAGGNYFLLITDDHACESDTVFLVYEAGLFIAQVSQKTNVTCYGLNNGTATISVVNGQAPFTYQWSDQSPFLSSDTFVVRTGMAPNTYYITVTDNNSKTSNTNVKINSPSAALALLLQPSDLRCYNDSSGIVDLTVTGGTLPYSFNWNNGFTGEDLVSIGAGNYSVVVTDANGCFENGATSVGQPDPFVTNITLGDFIHCYGEKTASAIASSSGGYGSYSYTWNDPGHQSTSTAYSLAAGFYTVTVTDQNECISEASVTITQPAKLTVAETHTNILCAGDDNGQIVPTLTGGTTPFEYIWSSGQTTRIISNLQPGMYSLTITDYYNCSDSSLSVEITEPPDISIISQVSDSNTITVVAEGGTPPLSFTITGGTPQSTGEFIDLPNGTYTVAVSDANGCGPVYSDEFIISIVGLEESRFSAFNLYPNPSDGKFNLVFESSSNEIFIEVLNITGMVIYQKKIIPATGRINVTIDLSSFPNGMYLMKINNAVVRERLIID